MDHAACPVGRAVVCRPILRCSMPAPLLPYLHTLAAVTPMLVPPFPRLPPCPPTAQEPKACSVVLRGASKDVLNEVERNLHDAMGVARNVCIGRPVELGGTLGCLGRIGL